MYSVFTDSISPYIRTILAPLISPPPEPSFSSAVFLPIAYPLRQPVTKTPAELFHPLLPEKLLRTLCSLVFVLFPLSNSPLLQTSHLHTAIQIFFGKLPPLPKVQSFLYYLLLFYYSLSSYRSASYAYLGNVPAFYVLQYLYNCNYYT